MTEPTPEELAQALLEETGGHPTREALARTIRRAMAIERGACARIANGLKGAGSAEQVSGKREAQVMAGERRRRERPREFFEGPETKAEILEHLDRNVNIVGRFVSLEASRFAFSNPEDVPQDVWDDLNIDEEGWLLLVKRECRLEFPSTLRVQVAAGSDPLVVLDELDRVRQELVRRPELLSAEWTRPLLDRRPRLRAVPAGEQ